MTELKEMKVEFLKKVRVILEDPERWAHGASEALTVTHKVCLIQATCKVYEEFYSNVSRFDRVIDHELGVTAGLQRQLSEDIAIWNDHPDRTHGEVLDLIDKTIERLSA